MSYFAARHAMVIEQLIPRGITDARVLTAMQRIPREHFVPLEHQDEAYSDRALPIDCRQTISQPLIVAIMTQALALTGDETVLEIGTGSGYQTSILAELAARVISVERHEQLHRHAADVLRELGYANVELVLGDGTNGWPEQAPYDRVIVTAAASSVPQALVDQLRDGGLLVIPVGDRQGQTLESVRKHGSEIIETRLTGCRFVPLVGQFEPE